jgi:hypothetical protein
MLVGLAFQHKSAATLILVCGDYWSCGTDADTNVGHSIGGGCSALQVAVSPHPNSNGRVPLI